MFSQNLAVAVTYTMHISIFVLLDGSGPSTDEHGIVTIAVFASTFGENCTIFAPQNNPGLAVSYTI